MATRALPPPASASPRRAGDRYHALGGIVDSDFPLADLEPARDAPALAPAAVVRRHEGTFPPLGALVREVCAADGRPLLRQHSSPAGLQMDVAGVGRFWIDPAGMNVRYRLERGAAALDVESYLLGPVLTVAAQMRGEMIFHAGAFLLDEAAVAFTAPSGGGKSTLAASVAHAGYPLLSDDVLPVREERDAPMASPYLPKLKLRDDSLAMLGEAPERFARTLTFHDKRRVRVEADGLGRLATRPVPLRAFYRLAPHRRDERAATVDIQPLDPAQACLVLHSSVYTPELLAGARAGRTLAAAARLAAAVPVRVISYYRSYEHLAAVRDALIADARSLLAEGAAR